jgi:hypothetical protein
MKKVSKHNKNEKYNEEDYEASTSKRKESAHRRPIRNWTKAWQSHEIDYDEYYEEFHKE